VSGRALAQCHLLWHKCWGFHQPMGVSPGCRA